jgi:hypothetical protein
MGYLPEEMRLLKLAHQYKKFAADATLTLQNQFTMPLPAETGLFKFNGWCPFKFEKQISAAKWQSKSYRLKLLLGPPQFSSNYTFKWSA